MDNKLKKSVTAGILVASCAIAAYGASTMLLNTKDTRVFDIADISVPTDINFLMRNGITTIENRDDLKIENNSDFGIEIKELSLIGQGEWAAGAYSDDYSIKPDNTKSIAVKVNGYETTSDGSINFGDAAWTIPYNTTEDIELEVKIPYQTEAIDSTNIAVLRYTVGVQKHTVTFTAGENGSIVGEDGSIVGETTIEVNDGQVISLPEVKPNVGYIFDRWVNKDTGEDIISDFIVKDSLIVEARYMRGSSGGQTPTVVDSTFNKEQLRNAIDDITAGGVNFSNDTTIPDGVTTYSLSDDGNIVAYNENNILKVINKTGGKIVAPEDCSYLFTNYELSSYGVTFDNFDGSNIVDASHMFEIQGYLNSLEIDLSKVYFDNLKIADYMFNGTGQYGISTYMPDPVYITLYIPNINPNNLQSYTDMFYTGAFGGSESIYVTDVDAWSSKFSGYNFYEYSN